MKFKTPCLAGEFHNTRNTTVRFAKKKFQHLARPSHSEQLGVLANWTDPYDERLFAAVSDRFWREVEEYGVTLAACRRVCPYASLFKTWK